MTAKTRNDELQKAMRRRAAERGKRQPCRTCKGDGLVMNIETGLFDVCNKCDDDGMVVKEAQP
jgi:DnaJ-class molecular chaperone